MQPILFPDVEALLVDHLTARYAALGESASVHTAVPNPRPERFTLVPRLGGVARNVVVDTPTIGVECWAATEAQALALCQLTRAIIRAMPGTVVGGVMFYSVGELAGPTKLRDPASDQARYIYTPTLTCRGTAI
jgi:hypothetical protein